MLTLGNGQNHRWIPSNTVKKIRRNQFFWPTEEFFLAGNLVFFYTEHPNKHHQYTRILNMIHVCDMSTRLHGGSVSYVINDGCVGGGVADGNWCTGTKQIKKDLCMFVRCCCLKLYSVHACELRLSCLILKYKRFWPLLMCSSILYLCTYKDKNAYFTTWP